jgi:hypothetical protein
MMFWSSFLKFFVVKELKQWYYEYIAFRCLCILKQWYYEYIDFS